MRGAGAAFQKPSKDIAKIINTTGMPLKLPEGFSISIFAKNLGNPRVLVKDPSGNLLVSIPNQGRVVVLRDENNDGVSDETLVVAKGLNKPHGIAFSTRCFGSSSKKCKLYIAETDKVSAYDYDSNTVTAKNKKKILSLPAGKGHFTRTILIQNIHGEDILFISVGSSCNVCKEKDWRRAGILISQENGRNLKKYSSGLRNSVFMAEHPKTGQIWATEMGRDYLGDDLPPDEINIISGEENYGWPYCYGTRIRDKTFEPGKVKDDFCFNNTQNSYIDIPAHSAPLGLTFIPEQGWPEEWQNNLLVAYHGSWNRSSPTGYKVVRYKFMNARGEYVDKVPQVEDFISGWINEKGDVFGRPVDILPEPSGVLYISDDKAGVVYKVKFKGGG